MVGLIKCVGLINCVIKLGTSPYVTSITSHPPSSHIDTKCLNASLWCVTSFMDGPLVNFVLHWTDYFY